MFEGKSFRNDDKLMEYFVSDDEHTIHIVSDQSGGARMLTSTLKEICEHCGQEICPLNCEESEERRRYNLVMDGFENLLLAQAAEGIDISSASHCRALQSAMDGAANNVT